MEFHRGNKGEPSRVLVSGRLPDQEQPELGEQALVLMLTVAKAARPSSAEALFFLVDKSFARA
ncbi:MAG: hypothetical protein HY581_06470 [Nitrospirae bacterium]|nr:hypothetical protein [Nitrospirota bacterium]